MDIQKNLEQKLEALKSLKLADNHLQKLEARVQQLQQVATQLYDTLRKEYQDVEQLQKLSLRSVFEKILGDKEAQLEKERQEYLNITLKYNEVKKSLELLNFEKTILLKKLEHYPETKSQVHNLIRQREHSLILEDPLAKQLLQNINKRIDENVMLKRELHEAIIVGLRINKIMELIVQQLEQVVVWGQYALNQPDHHISKMVYVNRAKENIYKANQLIQEFEDEVADIYNHEHPLIKSSLHSFHYFTREFFDNLISDWVIIMKIKNSLYTVHQVNDKVTRVVRSLQQELKRAEEEQKSLKEKKEKIILALN